MSGKKSLGARLVARLAGDGPAAATEALGSGRVSVETADTDRLGVLLTAVKFRAGGHCLQAAELRRRLQHLASCLDYLSEGLTLVEHDPARTGALMRSARPRPTASGREYFEIRIERNLDLTLRRYLQPPDCGSRRVVPALLDRTTLARLIDDLAIALAA